MLHLSQLSNYLILEGSFSAVSTATMARNAAFCNIKFFRDLQDLYSPVGEKKTTEFVPPQKESFGKSKAVFMFKVGAKIDV